MASVNGAGVVAPAPGRHEEALDGVNVAWMGKVGDEDYLGQ